MDPPNNLIDYFRKREYSHDNSLAYLNTLLEKRQLFEFRNKNSVQKYCKDYLIGDSTISTIALAISPDGKYVATTHGDHTVKILDYMDGSIKAIFVGHPSNI